MAKEEKVKADDMVEITGTGTSGFLRENKKKIVHRLAAENLEAKGYVTIGDVVPDEQISTRKGKKKAKPLEM